MSIIDKHLANVRSLIGVVDSLPIPDVVAILKDIKEHQMILDKAPLEADAFRNAKVAFNLANELGESGWTCLEDGIRAYLTALPSGAGQRGDEFPTAAEVFLDLLEGFNAFRDLRIVGRADILPRFLGLGFLKIPVVPPLHRNPDEITGR